MPAPRVPRVFFRRPADAQEEVDLRQFFVGPNLQVDYGQQGQAIMANQAPAWPWLAANEGPPKPLQLKKKQEKSKTTKALPNGRMKNVRLADIMKAYAMKAPIGFVLVDFRQPRIGEYFMDHNWDIRQFKAAKNLPKGLRLVFEFHDLEVKRSELQFER